jgi:hypothetical protein
VRRKPGEDFAVGAKIEVIGVGSFAVGVGRSGIARIAADEIGGVANGQGFEQNRVHQSEDRGGGSDAQHERGNGRGGEAGLAAQDARGIAHVAPEGLEDAEAPQVATALGDGGRVPKAAARRAF